MKICTFFTWSPQKLSWIKKFNKV